MSRPYKSFVKTGDAKRVAGWGIINCSIDGIYDVWCVENYLFIEEQQKYDYDLFVDVVSEMPVYFFITFDQALAFAKRVSNRYPIDRMMYWLRFQPEYWFSTVCINYIDYLKYIHSINYLNDMQHDLVR